MTKADMPLLRLAALRLAGHQLPTVAGAARWLTASQAQDLRGGMTSLALRTVGGTTAGVEAALTSGQVVRSWPMRGTLHFVAAEDLAWMLSLGAPRVLSGTVKRRDGLGLDASTLARGRTVAEGALAGGAQLSRDELYAVWRAAGIETMGQRGIHLLAHLALTGVVCFGPVQDAAQLIVLLEEWVPEPRRLEHDEALGEWALRYFRSHGPASVQDFARWTKLPLGESRKGIAIAREQLDRLEVDGLEHWLDPETPALLQRCRERAEGVFLLPGFDEWMLGYRDRAVMVPPEFADRVVPGNNGVFQPTVVSGGRVIGTWKRAPRSGRATVDATPFTSFDDRTIAEIEQLFAALP